MDISCKSFKLGVLFGRLFLTWFLAVLRHHLILKPVELLIIDNNVLVAFDRPAVWKVLVADGSNAAKVERVVEVYFVDNFRQLHHAVIHLITRLRLLFWFTFAVRTAASAVKPWLLLLRFFSRFELVWFDYVLCRHYYLVLFNFHLYCELELGFWENLLLIFLSLLDWLLLDLFESALMVIFGINTIILLGRMLQVWLGRRRKLILLLLIRLFLLRISPLVCFLLIISTSLMCVANIWILHSFFYHELNSLHFVHRTFLIKLLWLLNLTWCKNCWLANWWGVYFDIFLIAFRLTRVLWLLALVIRAIGHRVIIVVFESSVGKLW